MKANTRHVQGSTRSRGTTLSRSATPARRSESLGQNADKTRTKCIQNRRCHFINYSVPTIYNFHAVKCLHLSAAERFPLPRGEGQGEGQTCSSFSVSPRLPICPSAGLPFQTFAS